MLRADSGRRELGKLPRGLHNQGPLVFNEKNVRKNVLVSKSL